MLERWLRWHSVGMKMATVNMGMMMMMMSWMVLGAEAAVAPAPAVVSNSSVLLLGGLLAYNSTIGIAAQAAIELAVSDVNAAGLLGGRQLVLHLTNTNCSAFQGAASGKQADHQNLLQEFNPIRMNGFSFRILPSSLCSRVTPVIILIYFVMRRLCDHGQCGDSSVLIKDFCKDCLRCTGMGWTV